MQKHVGVGAYNVFYIEPRGPCWVQSLHNMAGFIRTSFSQLRNGITDS